MIINLRGTHGSGKSTAVRRVMGKCPYVCKVHTTIPEAVRPIVGYDCKLPNGQSLYVLGNYANACGGADGIQDRKSVV